ncbi:MAG: ribosomal protein L20 [Bacteroidia bacterium]|jgi:ribosomal protein L20
MRSTLIILMMLCALSGFSQETYNDASHYAAYTEGEWETVLNYGKLAKKEKKDYFYLRVRNGYSNFMVKRYRMASKELSKALKFNSADRFSKKFDYWSLMYSGEYDAARLMASKFTQVEKDLIKVIKPKLLSAVSLIGGYKISTLPNTVSGMPYAQLNLSHEIGGRLRLDHAVSYLSVSRNDSAVWQIGYLAQVGIQATKTTTIRPFFLMQYWELGSNWESGGYSVYDLGAGISVRQRIGNVDISVVGGYMERTLDRLYQAGLTFSWFPLGNASLYIHTSNSIIGGDGTTVFSSRETIGGNIYKGLWLSSTFVYKNELIPFEAGAVNFSNTSLDELQWKLTTTMSYLFDNSWSMSANYSVESREYIPSDYNLPGTGGSYYHHGLFVGLTKKF